ncbi:alkaline phosphatase D family protein [Novosphingobium sp. 1949]|uniref:Alkaline phosphatase D family protein n=1 Tax=Novosphingobium organovorum TaxID=2930092 RepID=A0ABT0BCV0_9SPHN|nr:alkaline phosphatase D family protein [Novosphingobium organovorum]MCJ2182901.1 alkaline phosphatase D family protein [Novosphingobium organovorum]
MISRRSLIHSAAGLAAGAVAAPAIVRAQSWFTAYPFTLGVASGDPASDGFVIWTRLAPDPYAPHGGMPLSALPVEWEVASDERFRTIAAKGTAIARPELGHSVHVEVAGLQPDRPYWYRFTSGSDRSLTGQARTLPPVGAAVSALRFGICGCQHFEAGFYAAYRHLAAEDLAFVFHYGDFIYEYQYDHRFAQDGLPVQKVRQHRLRALYSVEDFRAHYAQYLQDLDLQSARMRHAFLATFDDHEIEDNWVGDHDKDPSVPPEVFALRRQAAMQVWYEHMPVRKALFPRGELIHANRRLTYGNLAALNLLDTRSFRSDQPCNDGWSPACPGVYDSKAEVLGAAQEAWLDANLHRKDATWNVIGQQVMMMPIDRRIANEPEKLLNLDSWAAYDAPRKRLMKRLGTVENAVVFTGDEHQNFAGLLLDGDRPVAVENVLTSISSGGDGSDRRKGSDRIMANNPQVKFLNDQRGYGVCEVSPEALTTRFMVLDKVSVPDGAIRQRASATVERGKVALAIA